MHLRLTDVRVPKDNILLGEGRGFEISQLRLGPGRIHHCMRSIGAAERALELMVTRGLSREAFGKPLISLGKNTEVVARARIEIEAMRLMVLKAAKAMDLMGNAEARVWVSAVKAMVPKRVCEIIDEAIQIHGATGVSQWTPLAEHVHEPAHAAPGRRTRRGPLHGRRPSGDRSPPADLTARGADMKQLSGLDASFLYMETGSQFGHVSSLSIYERPDDPDYEPLSSWRHQIERRLHLLEPLRRRLLNVPFNLDHPYWVDDPGFDLDFHVRHTAVAPPGDDEQIAELVARIIGRPLDRSRPLWESYVIEGLPDDRFAILTKVHHATIDGAAGAELLTLMLDGDPEGDEIEAPEDDWVPRAAPERRRGAHPRRRQPRPQAGPRGRAGHAHGPRARRRPPATRWWWRPPTRCATGCAARSARCSTSAASAHPRASRSARCPGGAPSTPFNAAITPHRRFAYRSTSLTLVKDIKNALGATVNDVVMAACARRAAHLAREARRAARPAAHRHGAGVDPHRRGDREVDEPGVEHLRLAAHRRARPAPARRARCTRRWWAPRSCSTPCPADALTDFAQFPPPAVFARAMRTATRLSTRFQMPVNVTISNVPGPAAAALHRRRQAAALLPGVDDRRRPGPQHHRAELPRHARLRAGGLPGARPRPVGHARRHRRGPRGPRQGGRRTGAVTATP